MTREAFEDQIRKQFPKADDELLTGRRVIDGRYASMVTEHAWLAWQAATAAALERKPMDHDEMMDGYCNTPQFQQFVQAFEAGVRYAEAFHGIKELAPAGSELPTNSADQAEVTSQGQIPAWHDAPTVPGNWILETLTGGLELFEEITQTEINNETTWPGRWYGPIPPDGDKP